MAASVSSNAAKATKAAAVFCGVALIAALLFGCLQEKQAGDEPTPPAPPSENENAGATGASSVTPSLTPSVSVSSVSGGDQPPQPPALPN
jgi:hypothetical protein